ncbi:MAG: hypothetical protein OJF51_001891 [Nitrospira sp.]|nr:MAG: hypothetical protein OJF51_001891 [Nitrospira sp.]
MRIRSSSCENTKPHQGAHFPEFISEFISEFTAYLLQLTPNT